MDNLLDLVIISLGSLEYLWFYGLVPNIFCALMIFNNSVNRHQPLCSIFVFVHTFPLSKKILNGATSSSSLIPRAYDMVPGMVSAFDQCVLNRGTATGRRGKDLASWTRM